MDDTVTRGAPGGWRRGAGLWLPPLLLAAAVFFLSGRAVPPALEAAASHDKLAHFLVYGALGALLARALRGAGLSVANAQLWALLLGTLYGVSDEIHQSFVPARSPELLDALADAGGSAVGALGWLLAEHLWRRRRSPR